MSKIKLLREYNALCENGICDITLLNEAEQAMQRNGRTILTGVLQRADTENGNGRIYSKRILQREDRNYQKLIREKRALGECVEEGSLILTKDGWKDFRDLNDDEYIYTLNEENHQLELQRIDRKVVKEYNGDIFHFESRNIDIRITPKHRFYLIDRDGKDIIATAEEIYSNRKKYNKCYIPKLADWSPPEEDGVEFIIPGVDKEFPRMAKERRDKYSRELRIDLDVFVAFMGIYLSEGHAKTSSYNVTITQNEGIICKKIRDLLSGFPEEIQWKEYHLEKKNGKTKVTFSVSDARLNLFLRELGKAWEKRIPKEIKMLSPVRLETLLHWYILGDGRVRESNDYLATEVFSTSKELIHDLQEILLKSGGSGNIQIRKPYDRMIEGRVIKKENQRDLYILHLSTTRGVYLDERHVKIEKEKYKGKVYCVTVPNSTFYCMNNGKSFWSKNCDHPDDSVVNLKNASHMVLRTFWKGPELWGTIQVLSTPSGKILEALINDGVQLGISSRGLGSVDESGSSIIVQEDFALIAFDCVSDPSTPGAFMMKESKMPIREALSKADRINRLLTNIVETRNG